LEDSAKIQASFYNEELFDLFYKHQPGGLNIELEPVEEPILYRIPGATEPTPIEFTDGTHLMSINWQRTVQRIQDVLAARGEQLDVRLIWQWVGVFEEALRAMPQGFQGREVITIMQVRHFVRNFCIDPLGGA
jgi:hypothetical protein